MGHGSDKLYITHSEHSGVFGQHSAASVGAKVKQQAPHPGNRTPFDCCALSFQPFSHPVCARNADGTGAVFDLVNIVPWLKQHDNKNPVTGEELLPASLIALHYARKPDGQIHDPISFKPFSEHSHIVAIATTGNVFLADSVKGNRDLIADVPFKKEDVITLQNPHGLPTASVAAPAKPAEKAVVAKDKPAAPAVAKAKADVPYNVSPYSTGLPGASLTSTAVDVHTATDTALWDEEELMYEDIVAGAKKKGKDIGKSRAYVRVVTSLGGGSLNLELYCEKAPKTCYNFLMLARQGKYDNVVFHRLIPGFMVQTGDPTGTGAGGESYWGKPFRDEFGEPGAAKHDERGCVAMANRGPDTNGSQWFITFKACPHLDKKHTVFGKLVGGEDVLDAIEALPRKEGTERPAKTIKVTEVVIYQDPFEDYKQRLAKRLARKAEAEAGGGKKAKAAGPADNMNWFGVRVGGGDKLGGAAAAGGVGKYLAGAPAGAGAGAKRPLPTETKAPPPEPQKKRKIGFGDFDGW